MATPQFLAIGHVCHDLYEGGHRLGGTASYASLTAQRLGLLAAVLTRSNEHDLESFLPDVRVLNVPSPATTIFQNVYSPGRRKQRLHAISDPIDIGDLPEEWRNCPIVLIGPIVHEVEPRSAKAFSGSLVGVSPQGWMRRWDSQGYVSPAGWEDEELRGSVSTVIVGEEDLPPGEQLTSWLEWADGLIVTEGEMGARIRFRGSWYRIPAYPASEVDSTGAGDVFAAAYMVRLHETDDPLSAALFASCAASISIEAPGLEGIPSRPQVEKRLRQYPENKPYPL